jgi:hypothetical protein
VVTIMTSCRCAEEAGDTNSICGIVFWAELESVVLPTDCEFPCSAITQARQNNSEWKVKIFKP